jgi:hypothetical protein
MFTPFIERRLDLNAERVLQFCHSKREVIVAKLAARFLSQITMCTPRITSLATELHFVAANPCADRTVYAILYFFFA